MEHSPICECDYHNKKVDNHILKLAKIPMNLLPIHAAFSLSSYLKL